MSRKRSQPTPAATSTAQPLTLSVSEAAHIAKVCTRTVGRWVTEQRFRSSRPIASGSGRRLIDRADFLRFLGFAEGAA